MKGMKGRLLKKLKTIRSIGYLKPDRILQVNASDGFFDTSPKKPSIRVQTQLECNEDERKKLHKPIVTLQEPEIIDVSELMRDLEDEEMDVDDDKENVRPETKPRNPVDSKNDSRFSSLSQSLNRNSEASGLSESVSSVRKHDPLSEIDVSSFRRPDLDSGSLFDPNLLAAFEQAVNEIKAFETDRKAKMEESNAEEEPPLKARRVEDTAPTTPLSDFEEKCPPGGGDTVVLYTTGLRGVLKTFENCNSIRFLLQSFRVLYSERDVSMHSEFREELWRTLGGKVVPPRLFIKGRYIGGAEEVLTLHEQGKFRPLFQGLPVDRSEGPCDGCAGVRFVVCFSCNGSHKLVKDDDDDGVSMQCPDCNENGLIVCPLCC